MLHRATLAVSCALALAQAAPALTIDNFEAGLFTVTDDPLAPAGTSAEQSGLPTGDVIGGVRFVTAQTAGAGAVTANATLATTPADDAAELTAVATGNFTFYYDGIADGVENGTGGALNLDLSGLATLDVALSVPSPGPVLRITLWDSDSAHLSSLVPAVDGINSFLLSTFTGVDLSDIQSLRLSVNGVAAAISVSDISANPVPEPGAGLLLGLGLGALGLRGRGRGARAA